MTGQGANNLRIIHNSRTERNYIMVDRTYRTRCGHLVRALQVISSHKVKLNNVITDVGHIRTAIEGQVKMHNKETGTQEWMPRIWTHYGEDLLRNTELDLVEHREIVKPQPTLFG